MEESVTYQAIVRKGRLTEARRFLLLIGEGLLGPPSATILAAINAFGDVNRIEELGKRLPKAANWEELLASPSRRRQKR